MKIKLNSIPTSIARFPQGAKAFYFQSTIPLWIITMQKGAVLQNIILKEIILVNSPHT